MGQDFVLSFISDSVLYLMVRLGAIDLLALRRVEMDGALILSHLLLSMGIEHLLGELDINFAEHFALALALHHVVRDDECIIWQRFFDLHVFFTFYYKNV